MRALSCAVVVVALLFQAAVFAEDAPAGDAKGPTAEAVLKEGLAKAAKEDKRVFLKFGAEWCGWCHKMDDFLAEEAMKPLFDKAFVIVRIDVEKNEGAEAILKEALGTAEGGIPSFAFLDAQRKVLAKSNGAGDNIGFPADKASAELFKKMIIDSKTKLTESEAKTISDRLIEIGKKLGF